MLARILDNHYIYFEQVTQGSEEALVNWFSARDPKSFYQKQQRPDSSSWDGWYRRYNTVKARLALPFKHELIECCNFNKVPLEIVDERPAPEIPAPQVEQITERLINGVVLEDYQVRCLRACCHDEIGIISAVTGSGKTELMCGLVKMFRCPTVIVTEQIVVLEQIVARLEMRNVVHNNDIGLFCHGHLPEGNLVIVGSIQSISSPRKPKPDDVKMNKQRAVKMCRDWAEKQTRDSEDNLILYHIFPTKLADALYEKPVGAACIKGTYYELLFEYCKEIEYQRQRQWYKTRFMTSQQIQGEIAKCELLLVDEADLATTKQYAFLFKNYFRGRRRYGFSGTPFDAKKPVQNLMLKENLGSIIEGASRQEVQEAGRIIPIRFHMFAIGPDNRHDARAHDIAVKEEMVENVAFHDLVATIPASFPDDGTLILVDTSPIEPLGLALEQKIPNSKFISGLTSKIARRKYISAFENREINCLIGSKILKRGLDLKNGVENLVIIGGGGKWSDFDQKVGRAVRLNKRGWARVFSFFFLTNKYLYRHSKESLKALVDMGYAAKVHTNGTEIDGQKFIRSSFRLPKPR